MIELPTEESALAEERKDEQFEDVSEESKSTTSEKQFQEAALRVIVQRNDFLLPNLIDMLRTHKTLEVSPYYQRRERWDVPRKSRLIESLLVNIPVPPVFLYENEFARYEVMDGQQRVSAIYDFFDNHFPLRGLEILTSLTGKRFHDLPPEIRAGLERRSLQAIILLKESTPSHESTLQLRRYVFERLNTGGVRLNPQEVRNCVYAGPFNDLLLHLSRHDLFTKMWGIPPLEQNEQTEPSDRLAKNVWYRQMGDVQLVLRVFALFDPKDVIGGMKRTLDRAMARYSKCSTNQLEDLERTFIFSLKLANAIGGDEAFRLPTSSSARGRPSASLFDAMLVAIMRNLDKAGEIEMHASAINKAIQQELRHPKFHELVVGRANTREATLERSRHIERMIASVAEI